MCSAPAPTIRSTARRPRPCCRPAAARRRRRPAPTCCNAPDRRPSRPGCGASPGAACNARPGSCAGASRPGASPTPTSWPPGRWPARSRCRTTRSCSAPRSNRPGPATHSADPSAWSATLRDQLHSAVTQQPGWRVGRGPLGRRAGAVEILITLLERWGRAGAADAVRQLAGLKPGAAVELLRIPQRLGPARSRQLLADAVYPAALALGEPPGPIAQRWLSLPAARYLRTDPLRDRLSSHDAHGALRWRHGETQALLELERGWCRQGACAICPLGRLNRAHRPPPGALIPSLNLPSDA